MLAGLPPEVLLVELQVTYTRGGREWDASLAAASSDRLTQAPGVEAEGTAVRSVV